MNNPINFLEKFSKFEDQWSPKVIAEMNDYQFKLVKIKGDFVTHNHEDTDEVFIVIEGSMKIHYEDRVIELKTGEMVVVKRGEKHRPYAEKECKIMLVEPIGTVNTGDAGGDLTAPDNDWI
jgi:mannose-6-phosphate isomerase-like protein (cupin superfamily)|tara:strand:+ start:1358 stop:1720 length:363 start_codon:yes stop_codon:yes gene_type:complete